jgi:hypothetical protein
MSQKKKSNKKAERQLRKWLKFWQDNLRLTDWKVELKYCYSPSDFKDVKDSEELDGRIEYDVEYKKADILIDMLEPEKIRHESLIHEVLHMFFVYVDVDWQEDCADTQLMEFAINSLSSVLYTLYSDRDKLQETLDTLTKGNTSGRNTTGRRSTGSRS